MNPFLLENESILYYKTRQLCHYKMSCFYYKTRQVLQNEPFITKRGTTILVIADTTRYNQFIDY